MININKSHSDHLLDALVYGTSIQKVEVMGCDIHWHSETKKNGIWKCDQANSFQILKDEDGYPDMINFTDTDRDYWLFGLLQPGVRSNWDWSFPERLVFPDDASFEIRKVYEHWGGDAHSPGYVTRAELKAKVEEMKTLRAQHLISPMKEGPAIEHHATKLDRLINLLSSDAPDEDQRIIFWFDN